MCSVYLFRVIKYIKNVKGARESKTETVEDTSWDPYGVADRLMLMGSQ